MCEQNETYSGLGSKVFICKKEDLHFNDGNVCEIPDDAIPVDVKAESANLVGDGADDKGWKQTFTFDMKQMNNVYDDMIIGAKKQALAIVEDYLYYKITHRMKNRKRKEWLRGAIDRLRFLQKMVSYIEEQGAFLVYITDATETILNCMNIIYLEMGKVVKVSTFIPDMGSIKIESVRKIKGKLVLAIKKKK